MRVRSKALLFIFLVTSSIPFLLKPITVSAQFGLEESYIYSVEVHINGSATCVRKRILVIVTEDDEVVVRDYLNWFREGIVYWLEKFSNDTQFIVNRASEIAERDMSASRFNVSAYILPTLTRPLGIIEYRFLWEGFALVREGQIVIGDAFEEGGLILKEGHELNIQYPEGYRVEDVDLSPDLMMTHERRLAWSGPKNFPKGTPRVVLTKEAGGFWDATLSYGFSISLVALSTFFVALVLYRSRMKKQKESVEHARLATLEVESEEEKIVNLIKASNGILRQSVIGEKLGVSRSKISETLSEMERRGIIKRQKRGREKIVILLGQQNNGLQ